MKGRIVLAVALLLGATAPAAPPAVAQVHNDTVEDLPDAPGRETVFYACTACHGVKIITQQGQTAERWDATIDFMIERHGMAAPPEEDRRIIVAYLAAQFPSKQKGYSNPFLKK
ncbi:cytochrome C-552 [Azospirillum sp.]|uniref:cytochrome C-552 n=1 Tax=Azospirillum sp. TaxID=34012 RepID=UPI002D416714|nr:cytochrome C-552 [Azospirillum sp.]HYD69608.1 cytochrome C-552 [Azospirillum sp.]